MKTFIIAMIAIMLIYFALLITNIPASSSDALKPYQDQVAQDFVQQYEMVREAGTDVDRCIRAQLVAEGYLQAENQELYTHWRGVQDADCKQAGIAF